MGLVPVRRLILLLLALQSPDLYQQFAQLDARSAAAFAAGNCEETIRAGEEAVKVAPDAAKAGLCYRRIGLCKGRMFDLEGSLAAYRKGVEVSETSADPEILEENLHGLGLALQRLGRLHEAMAPAQREQAMAAKCPHPEHTVRSISLLAGLTARTGHIRQAIGLAERGLALARTAHDTRGIAVLLDNLANWYSSLGDVDYGLKMEQESISLTSAGDIASLAEGEGNVAAMFVAAGRTKDALDALLRVLDLTRTPETRRTRIGALLNIAEQYNKAGEAARALPPADEAVALARQIGRTEMECEALWIRARVLAKLHRTEDGRRDVVAAIAIARRSGAPGLEYEALTAAGQVEDEAGDRSSARRNYEAAAEIGEFLRADGPGDPAQLRRSFERQIEVYQLLVKDLIALGEPEAALRTTEKAKARVLMDILLGPGLNESAVMTPAEHETEAGLRRAAGNGATEAIRELERFRRRIYVSHPELAVQSGNFAPPEPDGLAALIPDSKTALIEFFRLPEGFAMFVVRKRGGGVAVTTRLLNLSAPRITRFRDLIAKRNLDYKTASLSLWKEILGPALPDLKDSDRLILSPDGALWELPFGALLNPAGRHLLETHALSFTPSFAALVETRTRPERQAPLELLALADPGLPGAGAEIRGIASAYRSGNKIVSTMIPANEGGFRAESSRARIIHLAVHGNLNNGEPLYSSLEFESDEQGKHRIFASDLLQMRLPADLVVLSACETALGNAAPGEGMIGMGWALAAAGARASVLSYWKIGSQSAGRFMVDFHRQWAKGAGARSLQAAALKTMRDPATRHPFYWAAFALWGDAEPAN